jgi:acyl carrier protein
MIKKKEVEPEWIEKRVIRCISDVVCIDEDKINKSDNMIDNLGMDSLDGVELIMALEEEFGIEIPDEDTEKVYTVQDVLDYIEKKMDEL